MTKLHAQAPSNNHDKPDNNIHPYNPRGLSNSSNGKLVHDPGGNNLNTKDSSTRDDDGSSSNVSRTLAPPIPPTTAISATTPTSSTLPAPPTLALFTKRSISSSNCKLVHDPGRNAFNNKDFSTPDDGDSTGGGGNVSCTADIHRSNDHDRDRTVLMASDIDPVAPLDFVQATCPDPTSPHRIRPRTFLSSFTPTRGALMWHSTLFSSISGTPPRLRPPSNQHL